MKAFITATLLIFGCSDAAFVSAPLPEDARSEASDPDVSDTNPDTWTPPFDTGPCSVPAGKECTTYPLCGCSSDQNCIPIGTSGVFGCGAAGVKGLNEPCFSANDCQRGMACIDQLCVPYCVNPSTCPNPGMSVCMKVVVGVSVCTLQCNLMDPKLCGPGLGCAISPDATSTHCRMAGSGVGAGACTGDKFACASGYHCFTNDCRKYCRVGMTADCPGTSCQTFTDHPKIGGYEYGICSL